MTTTPEPHSQLAHREAVRALPRPSQIGMDSSEVSAAARVETRDTFKVYVKDWLWKFTGTEAECYAFAEEKYGGRVEPEDLWVAQPYEGAPDWRLCVRLWNVHGEFKTEELAINALHDGLPDWKIVGRNSRAEVELKDYGIKKLVK